MNRSFRDFDKMARAVLITRSPWDMTEVTRIYGPYETVGRARAALMRDVNSMHLDRVVDYWVETVVAPVQWQKVED